MGISNIYQKLKAAIGNDFGVFGLMGNLMAESGLRANNLQNTYEKKLGMSDEEYTKAVDDGSYTNFVKDSAGYGLAQWTYWSRKQKLLQYAQAYGCSIGDENMQIDFMIGELMSGYISVLNVLKNAKTIREASDCVLTQYERPADQSESVKVKRAAYGEDLMKQLLGSNTTTEPEKPISNDTLYRVQVGAYSKKENADNQLKAVKVKGFDAFITQVDGLYKVQVGAYSVKANAEAQLAKVKAAGFDAFITTKAGTAASTPVFCPYKVRVSIKDLNIRKGPGTNYASNGFCPVGVYTIIEESNGAGATKWGKLKSGAGWISLDYAKRV